MKSFIVYGSTSDKESSDKVIDLLSDVSETEFHVISAHRNLEQLQEELGKWQGDIVVAGAGLAAALPGVAAAIVDKPVFGVPVAAHFGGLDALASMAQMPFGMPVLTCAPYCEAEISSFLKKWVEQGEEVLGRIHFVVPKDVQDTEHLAKELNRARDITVERGYDVSVSDVSRHGSFNILYVQSENDVNTDILGVHVPLFEKEDLAKPETYLTVLNWMKKGGLWVGANNSRNAVLSAQRMFNMNGLTRGTREAYI